MGHRADDVSEGVGRAEHEPEEEGDDDVDDEGRPPDQRVGGSSSEAPDHGRGVAAEDDGPQQDGPGQGRPQSGDRVQRGRGAAVVVRHVGEREVVGEEGVLHGHDRHQPAEQDEWGVELATAQGRLSVTDEAGGDDHDAHHRGAKAEEDAGVTESAVHRVSSRHDRRVPLVTAWSRWGR